MVVDGEGVIAFSYILNNVNSCKVFIDGKILTTADSSGKISNAVTSGSNSRQWVSLTLTGDRRRVIAVQGPSTVVSLIHDPGITVSKPAYIGKALAFGDSFLSRTAGGGETSVIHTNMGSCALRLLGWDVVDTSPTVS